MADYIKKISVDDDLRVTITDRDGGEMAHQSVNTILLYKILEKLEEIRCGLIDIETAIEKQAGLLS